MFDKDLFFSLCERYGVELSETLDVPMIKEGGEMHEITESDVKRIFAPHQTYCEYSANRISAKVKATEFYLQEDYAIAC